MWQTEWATGEAPREGAAAPIESSAPPESVSSLYLLHWSEHCVECAPPTCYATCPLFVPRADRKCSRLWYGIRPHGGYRGLYPYGADVRFRRWGKLESTLTYGVVDRAAAQRLDRLDRRLVRAINPLAGALSAVDPRRRLNGAYAVLRDGVLARRCGAGDVDELLVEVWNPGEAVDLVVEAHQGRPRLRTALALRPGRNVHRIPARELGVDLGLPDGVLRVFPAGDAEARLIFTWLDLVRYAERPAPTPGPGPAPRVKCVVWDLDNTLWRGVLVEDGPEGVELVAERAEAIRVLDRRGVLHSVASKNDHALAWAHLERLGLAEYFLYPAIHLGPKSGSVRGIAKELGLGLDSFAFVDDSAFERAEVGAALPQVRVYDAVDAARLPELTEFDVEQSEESVRRRLSYMAEATRKRVAPEYGADHEAFLRGCGMEAEVFVPVADAEVRRCLELLQRSNQLNLSVRRHHEDALRAMLANPALLCVAVRCRDRFGDYGTVGFASIDVSGERPVLVDLVVSCRVARKRMENAWFAWLAAQLAAAGHATLAARYKATPRNGVLRDVLVEIGFVPEGCDDDVAVLALDLARSVPQADIVHLTEVKATVRPAKAAQT